MTAPTPGAGEFPQLPAEDIQDGEIRVWTTAQLHAFAEATVALRAQESNPWREAIDEALIVNCLDCLGPNDEPADALARLISWEVSVALDPAVSAAAQALIDRGRAQAAEGGKEKAVAWRYRVKGESWEYRDAPFFAGGTPGPREEHQALTLNEVLALLATPEAAEGGNMSRFFENTRHRIPAPGAGGCRDGEKPA